MEKYDIVKFVDDDFELNVRADKENETLWLTQEEKSELFGFLQKIMRRYATSYKKTAIGLILYIRTLNRLKSN